MRRLALALAICCVGAYALAQTVVQQTISGNEVWSVSQGPGGAGSVIGINTVRNGIQFATTSGTGSATSTATGGVLEWTGTAPTTWTVTTPKVAFDGEMIILATDTTLTTNVTLSAASGQSLHGTYSSMTITASTAGTASPNLEFTYHAANSTWYRIQ